MSLETPGELRFADVTEFTAEPTGPAEDPENVEPANRSSRRSAGRCSGWRSD